MKEKENQLQPKNEVCVYQSFLSDTHSQIRNS